MIELDRQFMQPVAEVELGHGQLILVSEKNATGQWAYGDPIFMPPAARDWWFDLNFMDFNNLPPATPYVGSVLRLAFRQEFVL